MTLANRLTILRILMTPVITVLLLYKHVGAALALFVLAGITDGLDGFVARSRGQRTALGMVLDPVADKLLLMSAVIALSV
ncbi:MAG TPA: CDP-alcohol phosphatidyltransferase family protein, partial [Candidatus Methylomirabilis sp.]